MSITKDFESKIRESRYHLFPIAFWAEEDVRELLAHARALEAMLKGYMYAPGVWSNCSCCGKEEGMGHFPNCQLAKLLEGVE